MRKIYCAFIFSIALAFPLFSGASFAATADLSHLRDGSFVSTTPSGCGFSMFVTWPTDPLGMLRGGPDLYIRFQKPCRSIAAVHFQCTKTECGDGGGMLIVFPDLDHPKLATDSTNFPQDPPSSTYERRVKANTIQEISYQDLVKIPPDQRPASVTIQPIIVKDGRKLCGDDQPRYFNPWVSSQFLCETLGYKRRADFQLENIVPAELMYGLARSHPYYVWIPARCLTFIKTVTCDRGVTGPGVRR